MTAEARAGPLEVTASRGMAGINSTVCSYSGEATGKLGKLGTELDRGRARGDSEEGGEVAGVLRWLGGCSVL